MSDDTLVIGATHIASAVWFSHSNYPSELVLKVAGQTVAITYSAMEHIRARMKEEDE